MEDGEMVVFRDGCGRILAPSPGAPLDKETAPHRLVAADGGKGRLQALHAQGDLRAAPGSPRHHRRPPAGGGRGCLPGGPGASATAELAAPWSGCASSPAAPPGTPPWWANSTSKSTAAFRSRWTSPRNSATANPVIDEHTLVMLISQSGETADTLAALREGQVPGRHGHGDLQRGGLLHRPRSRQRDLHPRRPGDRRRLHQGLRHPVDRPVPVHHPPGTRHLLHRPAAPASA